MAKTKTATVAKYPTWGRLRRSAFYVAVGLSLLSMLVTGPLLTLPVTAWFPEATLDSLFGEEGLGIHRVHMKGAALVFWMTIVALVSQIRSPERRAAPLWAAAAAWVVFLPIELTHLTDPYSIVVTVLVLMVLALHPRRWPVATVEFRARPRLLAIPYALVVLVYAYQQAILQFDSIPEDPHAVVSHYELMAALAVGLAVSALLGATNFPGNSVSAWTAGLMTLTLGIFFIGHANQTSSVGVGWGAVLVGWALFYLLASALSSASEPVGTAA